MKIVLTQEVEVNGCLGCPYLTRGGMKEEVWYCEKKPSLLICQGNPYVLLSGIYIRPGCPFDPSAMDKLGDD